MIRMPPKPLYKYCRPDIGIEYVLEQETIKWSRPYELDDPFDINIDIPLEELTHSVIDEYVDTFLTLKNFDAFNNLNYRGIKISGEVFGKAVAALRASATSGDITQIRAGALEGINALRRNWPAHTNAFREEFKDMAVFCMSELHDENVMWSLYAQRHEGLVIAFSPNHPDSQFGRAQQIEYITEIPKIKYTDYLSLPQHEAVKRLTKWHTLLKKQNWSYQHEWRVIVAGGAGVKPFHKEDIDAVYLGCRMSVENKERVVSIVQNKYPNAKLYIGSQRDLNLVFDEIKN